MKLVSGTAVVASLVTLGVWTSAQSVESRVAIATVSARPDMASGGEVLVRVTAPPAVPLAQLRVSLNRQDITSAFHRDEPSHTLLGLASSLKDGPNTVAVAVDGPSAHDAAQITVTNHPIAGPIFSGPHEEPFICETESFKLPSGETLGKALDADCSIRTRVDYFYRSTAGGNLKPLTPPSSTPSDLARTKTTGGATVPYIVRIETGTINRSIYQIAMLHNPSSEGTPDPWTKPAGWNRKLIYTHGGGCTNGWYRQGSNTGGIDDDVMLRQGYAVASASLNVFGNNCNDLLASETMMMVKERFIEAYGPPRFTIGWGCSGGSYQQLQTADNYPGLIDGIIPCRTFPDVGFDTIPVITDARLFNRYFKSTDVKFSADQQKAVVGFVNMATMKNLDETAAGRIQVSEYCPPALPLALRYHPTTNPKGARCDVYDHTVNAYGRDPKTGFARRPLDNVGVQYGLAALNGGSITAEQFLDLNARIGGFDNDGNVVGRRSEGDVMAIRAAYRTGRFLSGGGGLAATPIIDYRNYLDDDPDGNVHLRYHSFALRERLMKANRRADNHVMVTEDGRGGTSKSAVYAATIETMDHWLTALEADKSTDSPIVKIVRAKPADAVDTCWSRDPTPQKIVEKASRDMSTRCGGLYPTGTFPREIAGGPVAGDVLKCQLKPIQPSDYKVKFTADEMASLRKIFPGGVCDWTRPGIEQQRLNGTWQNVD